MGKPGTHLVQQYTYPLSGVLLYRVCTWFLHSTIACAAGNIYILKCEEGNNSKKSSSMSDDGGSSSDSDDDSGLAAVYCDSHTLYELLQPARAYNMEHAFIPLKQNKAALAAVLIERGVLTPAGGGRSPSPSDDGYYDDDGDDNDGYEYHADAADDADVFEERDMAAERAVERVLALPKNALSSLSGLYKE